MKKIQFTVNRTSAVDGKLGRHKLMVCENTVSCRSKKALLLLGEMGDGFTGFCDVTGGGVSGRERLSFFLLAGGGVAERRLEKKLFTSSHIVGPKNYTVTLVNAVVGKK